MTHKSLVVHNYFTYICVCVHSHQYIYVYVRATVPVCMSSHLYRYCLTPFHTHTTPTVVRLLFKCP